jgi:hypothetical protein
VADVAARELVMVARNENHARALAGLAQQLLHDVVVGLRPEPAAAQLPAVDDVADQEQEVALDFAQEVEQCDGPGIPVCRGGGRISDTAVAQVPAGRVVCGPRLGRKVLPIAGSLRSMRAGAKGLDAWTRIVAEPHVNAPCRRHESSMKPLRCAGGS